MRTNSMMARVWITAARNTKSKVWQASCLAYAARRREKLFNEIRESNREKIKTVQLDLFS